MLILSLHIIFALLTTLAIVIVLLSAKSARETKAHVVMVVSFAATALSGLGMLFVNAGGLGRLCAMMSAYTLVVAAAHYYYRARVSATSSL